MPFSSFNDPSDLARVQGALDAVWAEVRDTIAEEDRTRERTRLAYAVAALFPHAKTDTDLARLALERFRSTADRNQATGQSGTMLPGRI